MAETDPAADDDVAEIDTTSRYDHRHLQQSDAARDDRQSDCEVPREMDAPKSTDHDENENENESESESESEAGMRSDESDRSHAVDDAPSLDLCLHLDFRL